jgi:hypothetical protein
MNREALYKDQNNRNKNSYCKGKGRGGKEYLHWKKLGGGAAGDASVGFGVSSFAPSNLAELGGATFGGKEVHEDVGRQVGTATSGLVQTEHL